MPDRRFQAMAAELQSAGVYPDDYKIATPGVGGMGVYIRREDGLWHVFLAWGLQRPYERTFSDKEAAANYFGELLQALHQFRIERRLDRDEFRRRATELDSDEPWDYSFDLDVPPGDGWLIVPEGGGWQGTYWERGKLGGAPAYDARTESEVLAFVLEQCERGRRLPPPQLPLTSGEPPFRLRDVVIAEDRTQVRLETSEDDFLRVSDCRLREVDLSDARLSGFSVEGALFERCDFSRWRVGDLRFGLELPGLRYRPLYRACRFDGADLRRASIQTARFEGCSFDGALIADWVSNCGEFLDCSFRGAQISDTTFSGTPYGPRADGLDRQVNEFRGNDFRNATLHNVDFRGGIDLSLQKLPDGPDYLVVDRPAERIAQALELLEQHPASADRDAAISFLTFLRDYYGHESSFIVNRRHDLVRDSPESRELTWAALEATAH